jgi:heat induced stress protein YflT
MPDFRILQLLKPESTNSKPKRRANMSDTNAVIAVYGTHGAADNAVKQLQRSGFDMRKLSVVGKDFHTDDQVVGYYNAGDRMKYWGKVGAFWGGIWGLLFGAAFFWIPGVGPLLVAGPLAAWIVGTLEGAAVVGGLSALGGGLYSIGIPKNSVLKYETAVKADKFLLVVHGTAAEAANAKNILSITGPLELDQHDLEVAKKAAQG